MKISRLEIENFKGISSLSLDLCDASGAPRPLTLLLGDNGTGKTTVLQAIALVLGLATRRISDPTQLGWSGFLPERMASKGPTRLILEVVQDADERRLTRELHEQWAQSPRNVEEYGSSPMDIPKLTLRFEDGLLRCDQGAWGLRQLWGRAFIREQIRSRPQLRQHFAGVGDIFWFDQNRNNQSAGSTGDGAEERPSPRGIERLRDFLVGWWAYHTSPTQQRGVDYLAELERRYAELFAGTRFVGVAPREFATSTRATESYFLLERAGNVYDIAEMSSGEQAVFPLLYEFVRLSIAKSVVLIDELELHLHPPEQQALLAALRRIGPDCQFLCTTHSPYLEQVTPSDHEVRLPGGRSCL